MTSIKDYGISAESLSKLKGLGITELFPIQAQTFQPIRKGQDVVAQAKTGSGKTIAFALPIIESLQENDLERIGKRGRSPRVLTLAPTRELANQIAKVYESLVSYGGLTVLPVYGGTSYSRQESALEQGVDIVVGAPGRVKDLVQRGVLKLDSVRHVVLDEVDRMLDMGFLEDVDSILQQAYQTVTLEDEDATDRPQTLLFSATMPSWVEKTSKRYLRKNQTKRVTLVDEEQTPTDISHYAMKTSYHSRPAILRDLITLYANKEGDDRCIIFCERKVEADELSVHPLLPKNSRVLHGDVVQFKREKIMEDFRNGKFKILFTTDVAARGLDIPEVNLVIQCSPPRDIEFYIHRSGRTGRAGRKGKSICLYQPSEMYVLGKIEMEAGISFQRMKPPSEKELIKIGQEVTLENLEAVSEDTIELFKQSARDAIEKMGAERALAAAVAIMSGRTNASGNGVSLISNRPGHTAMIFRYNLSRPPKGKSLLYTMVQRIAGPNFDSALSFVQFIEGREGIVFDMDNQSLPEFEKKWKDQNGFTISRLTEKPDIEEFREEDKTYRNNSFGRREGNNGWHNSYQGRKGRNVGFRKDFGETNSYQKGRKRMRFDNNES